MNKMSVSYLEFIAAIIIFACIVILSTREKTTDAPEQSQPNAKNAAISSSVNEKNLHLKYSEHQQHKRTKPGAAVSLKNSEPLYATVPGVYEYQLQLLSPNHEGKMTVDVSTSDGLAIVSSAHHFEFELHEGGEYGVPLTINANAEGRFYIQLHITITADGQKSSRVIAAILQVGEPGVKAQKASTKGAGQEVETVISLPAQETISPR
ncbi:MULTISPECIES: hypothetical protein [Cellvibrio]|uniref:Uncharacterized protein n=1 Tax=Cellvibrio fibrivorans TaxID=126350 RepID=A0ABU1UVI1_9GAMM|nr:hypothetical protein [Cellvibrio fibrivorans]MDR7089184.1 hypothetical protein [Cellvibrio fibrivorans]